MPDHNGKRLILIVGPTAVGKTEVAIQLAGYLNTEIISADSRQVYKEMTIGTAKPTGEELLQVDHHFINQISVEEIYDAGKYGREALDLINLLFERYDTLIMCGGSGLYIRSALEGFDAMPEVPKDIRKQVIMEYDEKGMEWLQNQVELNDPEYYDVVDQKNPKRLMRALEMMKFTGMPVSAFRKNSKRKLPFELVKIGLRRDRKTLYTRINQRIDKMIETGLLSEARQLYPRKALNALQTVGYRELFGHFDGKYDIEEAIRLLKRNTRRYAKRQLTWFGKDEEIKWFDSENIRQMIEYVDEK